jgi:hypothetical protein
VLFLQGNYSDYEADLKRREGDAASPHRIRYKPLTR